MLARELGADVQALDGQGLELGPLLQRARPGARAARTSPGTSSCAPFDHQDDDRRAARLGHPLRGALQLRQAADPRLGLRPAARGPTPARSPVPSSSVVHDRLARWTDFWLTAGAHPATRCPTTSTATTAAGTTPRPSTPTGWSSHRTSPRSWSSSSTCSPTSAASWAGPSTAGRAGGRPADAGAARRSCGRPRASSPSGPLTGRAERHHEPARPHAARARRAAARRRTRRCWPTRSGCT